MSIGKTLLRIRLERGLTQKEVGKRCRLATSYLSRIENGHVQPTVRTLSRLLEALETEASEVFGMGGFESTPRPHRCPVSSSGRCVGEQIRSYAGAPAKNAEGKAHYGPQELEMLRMADFVILKGNSEMKRSLKVVLEAFMSQTSREN